VANHIANPIMKSETTQKLQDRSVASLKIQCPFCDTAYDFPEIYHKSPGKEKIASNICPNKDCQQEIPDSYVSNRVQLFLKQLTTMYYRGKFFLTLFSHLIHFVTGFYKCREPGCGHTTRELLNKNRCMVVGCKGRVGAQISESQANDTLRYLQGLFNVDKYRNEFKLKDEEHIPHEDMLNSVMAQVDSVLNKSKYNKVDLGSLFSFMVPQSAVAH
jgi:hypothetical protein